LPEAQALEHLLDHVAFVDEGHDPHLALTGRADEGIGFPDFLDEVPPFFGRDAAGLVVGHVDDLYLPIEFFRLLLGPLVPLASHLIGIPAIIVVFRRTNLGSAGLPEDSVLRKCTEIISKELKWDNSRVEKEMAQVREDAFLPSLSNA
jgi:hypothetical protein